MDKYVIGIVHNVPVFNGKAFYKASQDVLVQVDAVRETTEELGYKTVCIPFTKDINDFLTEIRNEKVNLIFNLCETVDEDPKLAWQPPAIMEYLGIPFSGSSSEAIHITTDKIVTKKILTASGIKTPGYFLYDGHQISIPTEFKFPAIAKPRFEDASIGINQDSIFENEDELRSRIYDFYAYYGPLIVEEYINGREFNVSVFGYPKPSVLPVAEIIFKDYPKDFYRILTYRAKWEDNSFEFQNSSRVFPDEIDPNLDENITKTTIDSFHLFKLRDYCRVDMRVNENDDVFVLEVNANPCLSPDAGFPAAIERAGISYSDMIGMFVDFLKLRSEQDVETSKGLGKRGEDTVYL